MCGNGKRSDPTQMSRLKVFKWKSKEGTIDRITDQYNVIGKGLFKKETDFTLFTGMTVQTAQGHVGTIEGSFGKSGKYKVNFPKGIPEDIADK